MGHDSVEVFVERLTPPPAVVLFGTGLDVVPVVTIAKALGWHVTVVGVRPETGMAERFAGADRLNITSAEAPVDGVMIANDSGVALMTHNFQRDVRILKSFSTLPRYLGILGPRDRTERVLEELPGDSAVALARQQIFSPIGLDFGAETPEQIALAVVAEMQMVFRSASGLFLRDRPGPIHRDRPSVPSSHDARMTASAASVARPACRL